MTSVRRKSSSLVRAACCALACGLLSTCATTDGPGRATTLQRCGPNCRVLPDGRLPPHPECLESADCGERPHAVRTMCIAGYVCEAACAEHWADCNKDYRDGCETPSRDGRCEGDEVFVSDPLASIGCVRESSLPEPYDCDLFTSSARESTDALDECYNRALRTQPGVEGALDFAVTVAPDGHVSKIVFLGPESSNSALRECAQAAIRDSRGQDGSAAQISATYPVRAVFVAGGTE